MYSRYESSTTLLRPIFIYIPHLMSIRMRHGFVKSGAMAIRAVDWSRCADSNHHHALIRRAH